MLGDDYADQGLVFTTGAPVNPSNLRQSSFVRLLTRAGLPRLRFHDLRHTCATLLLSKGTHAKFVQELLGHATVAITLDTYSHVMPGMGAQTARDMQDALSPMRTRYLRTAGLASGSCQEGPGAVPPFLAATKFYLQNAAISEWAMLGSNQRPPPCKLCHPPYSYGLSGSTGSSDPLIYAEKVCSVVIEPSSGYVTASPVAVRLQ